MAQQIFSVGFKVRESINYMNVVGCEWAHLRFVAAATIVRHNCQSSFLAPCERIASQSCVALLPMPVSTPAATSMVVMCNRFREYKRKSVGFGEEVIQAGSIN